MAYEYSFTKSLIEQNLHNMDLEREAVESLKGLSYWLYMFGF